MHYDLDIDSYIGCPYSSGYVKYVLEQHAGQRVNVRINSLGGSAADALDIRRQFLEHGDVHCYIYGMTASAATIVATGAKETFMSRFALYLAHPCAQHVEAEGYMNHTDLETAIADLIATRDNLEKVDNVMAAVYAERCGRAPEQMRAVMEKAEWLSAEEVVGLGLADGYVEEEENAPTDNGRPVALAQMVALGIPAVPADKLTKNVTAMNDKETGAPALVYPALTAALADAGIELPVADGAPLDGDALEKLDNLIKTLTDKIDALTEKLNAETEVEADNKTEKTGAENGPADTAAGNITALKADIETLRAQVAALMADDGADTMSAGLSPAPVAEPHNSAADRYRIISGLL